MQIGNARILTEEALSPMSGIGNDGMPTKFRMMSSYVDAFEASSYYGEQFSLHSHDYYEFVCSENSVGVEYLVGSARYRLQKGDIAFFSPGVSHKPMIPMDAKESYRYMIIRLDRAFMENTVLKLIADLELEPSGFFRTEGTDYEMLGAYFRSCVREARERKRGYEAAVAGSALNMIALLSRASGDEKMRIRQETPELLDSIISYIGSNLGKKITLEETARHFSVSRGTVSRVFSEKLGTSFYRFVTQSRLVEAKDLIERRLPLETVAEEVGFNDYSVFFRAFRKEYGISPREYRSM